MTPHNEKSPAPAPADERAAFESLKGAWQSMPPFDVFCAGWQAARAASANETGAEGAAVAWMSTDDPRDCISDAKKRDMIEHAGAPGARLAEKYSIALGVITPAQADARAGLTDEQRSTLESLARTSTPYEQEVLRSILAAHPGQPEPRAEVTDDQIADMFERVTGYSIENGRAALNDADILGFARELLDAARAGEAS